jgi:hypothetical protein
MSGVSTGSHTRRLLALAAAVATLSTVAHAQFAPQSSGVATGSGRIGPTVSALDSDPVMQDLGLAMNIIRTNEISWEAVNSYEATGKGMLVDLEAGINSPAINASRYTVQMHYFISAVRTDFETADAKRTIHVARADNARSWEETWTKGKYSSANGGNAAFRVAQMYLWPQAFARAAGNAEKGLCPNAVKCADVKFAINKTGAARVISVTLRGVEYKATLDKDNRPGRIEATIPLPQGGSGAFVATLTDYRDGSGLGPGEGEAAAKAVIGLPGGSDIGIAKGETLLDKYHSGMYSPGHIVWTVNGTKVLDITLSETWPNKYIAFPLPEEVAGK